MTILEPRNPWILRRKLETWLFLVLLAVLSSVQIECFHATYNANLRRRPNINSMNILPIASSKHLQFIARPAISLQMQTDDTSTASNGGVRNIQQLDDSVASEADKLRQKAKELMREANQAEVALRASKKDESNAKNSRLDEIFKDLEIILPPPSTTNTGDDNTITTRSTNQNEKQKNEMEMIRRLANIMREKRLSDATVEDLVVRQYELLLSTEKKIRVANSIQPDNPPEPVFNIGDLSNSIEYNELDLRYRQWFIERIIDAQSLLDKDANNKNNSNAIRGLAPILEARIRGLRRAEEEEYQRTLAMKVNSVQGQTNYDGRLVNNYSEQTLGEQNVTIKVDGKEIIGPKANMTLLMEDMMNVPQWVPSSILPFLIVCNKRIDPDDFKKIRSQVLVGSGFKVDNFDYTRTAAIYRGSFVTDRQRSSLYGSTSVSTSESKYKVDSILGGKQSAAVFQEIQERLEEADLAGKIQLFLMEDSEWRPGDRDPEPLPSILAVSTDVIPEQGAERTNFKKCLAGLAVVSTFFATFAYAIAGYALNPTFFDAVINNNDISKLSSCLPIILGVFGVSAVHELGHQIAANIAGVKIGLPVPLPSLQIGSFGSITPLRSFPKSRSAMFDVSMSGPVAGGVLSIASIIAGLSLSTSATSESLSTFAVVPAAIMKTSFLVGSIVSAMAPKVMSIPASQLIPIHPLFLVGFSGLVASALNLLPMGRLDGGRACTAIFGRRSSYLVSFATLLFLAIGAITQTSAISIFFGLLVTLFQRNADIPMRDELTDVGDVRTGIYIFSIVLTVLSLAPFPGGPFL